VKGPNPNLKVRQIEERRKSMEMILNAEKDRIHKTINDNRK
jgi:hypothetical protein